MAELRPDVKRGGAGGYEGAAPEMSAAPAKPPELRGGVGDLPSGLDEGSLPGKRPAVVDIEPGIVEKMKTFFSNIASAIGDFVRNLFSRTPDDGDRAPAPVQGARNISDAERRYQIGRDYPGIRLPESGLERADYVEFAEDLSEIVTRVQALPIGEVQREGHALTDALKRNIRVFAEKYKKKGLEITLPNLAPDFLIDDAAIALARFGKAAGLDMHEYAYGDNNKPLFPPPL